jgi:DGQHR domain-containing protein
LICSCCGILIEGEKHQIKDGFVCDRCWNNPTLFFSEKIVNSDIWRDAQIIMSTPLDNDYLELNVLKLIQKDVTLYSGKIKIKEILKLYSVFNFKEDKFTGYQRGVDEVKLRELYDYLINFPLAILPGLVISVRNNIEFEPIENELGVIHDFGKIKIPLKKGSLWIIDGQHRVIVFEKIIGSITNFDVKNINDIELFLKLMNFELAVIFVDSNKASSFLEKRGIITTPEDIEKAIFYVINKTQKRLSPSLEDSLQYSISKAGLRGLPTIERQSWRVVATEISIYLNDDVDSPLYNKLNLSGQGRAKKPIQLNSFVSSLKPLYYNNIFKSMSISDQKRLLLSYWKKINEVYKEETSDENYNNFILLTSMGIYVLNLILLDYINISSNSEIFDIN